MAIAGDKPETGVRIAIERPRNSGPPWIYSGEATLPAPEQAHRVDVRVEEGGTVSVSGAPADLAEKVRLIVRAAWKQAHADGIAPPWRIVRWRAEK